MKTLIEYISKFVLHIHLFSSFMECYHYPPLIRAAKVVIAVNKVNIARLRILKHTIIGRL